MVVADTAAWIEFFNNPESDEKQVIDLLIDEDELALVGPVLTELLQGCRTPQEANTVMDHLSALPFLETSFLCGKEPEPFFQLTQERNNYPPHGPHYCGPRHGT